MHALIPAAGRGTRLDELTEDRPKGLVDVAGRPLLAHVFDTAIEAGAAELVVVIGYEGAQIVDRFGDAYEGVPITYVHQRVHRGLGHAVLQADSRIDGDFLVVNGDNVFADAVTPAVDRLDRDSVDAVLGVENVSEAVARTTGVLQTDAGTVTGILEKPADPPSTTVTTGCYVLPNDIFHACALLQPSAAGEYQLSEAVGLLIRAGYTVETVRLGDRVNVNTPADIDRASELVRKR